LQDDAIANAARLAHDRVGMRKKIVADLRAAINRDGTVEHSVAADVRVFVDKTIRADVRVFADASGFRDDGGRMDPWSITRGW